MKYLLLKFFQISIVLKFVVEFMKYLKPYLMKN